MLSFIRLRRRAMRFACLTFLLALAGCAAERAHRDGMSAFEKNDFALAVNKLAHASELAPQDTLYRRDWLRVRETATTKLLEHASEALANNKFAEAEQSYKTIVQFDRSNARAISGLDKVTSAARAQSEAVQASAALKSGDIAKAAELAGRALRESPQNADAKAVRKALDAFQAQEGTTAPSLGGVYKKPLNLEFRDASIKMVFDALSRTTGINFIFDRDVKGDQKTTVFLKQTPLDDAIDVILATGQLDKKILNASSVLIYPNTPAKLREYQDLVVRAFYLANVEAKTTANMLKTVLKLKDVFVDDKYNMLILRESPETLALVERLIALHDMEEGEVMLEVEVLEINRSRLLNLGIQLSDTITIAPLSGLSSGSSSGSLSNSPTFKLSELKSINSSKLGISLPTATLNLQNIDGDANLLANPRIRVRDREKAKILIGDKVPVVTTTTSGTFVSENIQYLDVGLKLEVEPTVYLRDEVGLKLVLEVSSLVSSTKTNNGSQAYQIGTRNFSTALRLKDGETQLMAGLISDEDRSAANRIPLLGKLPILGRLFSSQSDNRKKTEIVLSITPHLVRNIQRKDLSAESFWSGTETTLRSKPLQLRQFDAPAGTPSASAAPAPSPAAPSAAAPATPADSGAPGLTWLGPSSAKVGEAVTLKLDLDSPELLRAVALQLAFDPAQMEILSVQEGEYFNRGSKGAFSHSIDNASGRVSLGLSAPDGANAKGKANVLLITCRPRIPVLDGAAVSVISATMVGAARAVGRPGLPLIHKMAVER